MEKLKHIKDYSHSKMNQFEKISFKQISILLEILVSTNLSNIEFIKAKYSENALNFGETVEFLKNIFLINEKQGRLNIKDLYKSGLKETLLEKEGILKNIIVENFIFQKNNLSKKLFEFLFSFSLENQIYVFVPKTSSRLKFSGIRNLLLELDFVILNKGRKYIISDKYLFRFSELIKLHKTSLYQFLKIIKERELLAKKAEIEVVKYEKNRLSQYPHLIKSIVRISEKDVGSGYDIKSFTIKGSDDSNFCERLIEVKAVSQRDFKFYWTKNEIEKSRLCRKNYYLYLVPVEKDMKFDIGNLVILQDPYLCVYKNKTTWNKNVELIECTIRNNKEKKKICGPEI